ncbi:unnamed protein product [Paramecium sonneborni]|uniref:Uncharacterized protein n=1 Tax=Paramecium sonneborni TaxID=65129 RepID=A0A8S1PT54_9CILI|nr:unnamed protein product [Paramecium sonneborni]
MNFTKENPMSKQEEQTIEKIVYYYTEDNAEKIKIQIKFTSGHQITYSDNRGILRVVKVNGVIENPEVFNNMNQIEYLYWKSQYDQNKKNICKWIVSWDQRVLKNVGGYQRIGKKQGLWVDLFRNFWNQERVFEIGEYCDGLRMGKWNFFKDGLKIGGGFYNIVGEKQGKWIELDKGFYFRKQVKYNGEYDKNGKKVGKWDILFQQNVDSFKLIGGGIYNQEGNQQKIGKWIELYDRFNSYAQITYKGQYNMNGMKVGRWECMFNIPNKQEQKQIGGGVYDQEGGQRKIGKWTELVEDFKVTYNGEYNMNGMKVGRWDIMQYDWERQKYEIIGGGSYDQKGNQIKIGNWVEFHNEKQVLYNGEYNMNGMKIGRWDIKQWFWRTQKYIQIGGGSYDQEGNSIKIGNWVELDEDFDCKKQIISHGEYNMNGLKVGRWVIMYCKENEHQYRQIGGGSYDQEGKQIKIGNWIEKDENCQVVYKGVYNLNGLKVGSWEIMYCEYNELEYKQIIYRGGGSYDQEGNQIKIGNWIDLDEWFSPLKQFIFKGQYNISGVKVGRWDIMQNKCGQQEYQQIGGGSYDLEGVQKKIGKWIELYRGYFRQKQVTFHGDYNMNGMKVGRWIEINIWDNSKRAHIQYDY